jgi:predicted RNA binding protein YcfA (HicA-like mRNA interferase family)
MPAWPTLVFEFLGTMCIYTLFAIPNSVYKYTMKSQDVIRALRSDGWEQVGQKRSHVQFKHPTKKGRVTVPHPKKDIPIGTLRSVEKQADLKLK